MRSGSSACTPAPTWRSTRPRRLTDISRKSARQLLDRLTRAHLIQATGPGRYAMHDLLRDYVRELAAADGEASSAQQ